VNGELVTGLGPRLAAQNVIDVDIACLDQAGLGIENKITLSLNLKQ
jgi:hypothetical protein